MKLVQCILECAVGEELLPEFDVPGRVLCLRAVPAWNVPWGAVGGQRVTHILIMIHFDFSTKKAKNTKFSELNQSNKIIKSVKPAKCP